MIKKRERGILYSVNSWNDKFYNHTNKDAEDFKISGHVNREMDDGFEDDIFLFNDEERPPTAGEQEELDMEDQWVLQIERRLHTWLIHHLIFVLPNLFSYTTEIWYNLDNLNHNVWIINMVI